MCYVKDNNNNKIIIQLILILLLRLLDLIADVLSDSNLFFSVNLPHLTLEINHTGVNFQSYMENRYFFKNYLIHKFINTAKGPMDSPCLHKS